MKKEFIVSWFQAMGVRIEAETPEEAEEMVKNGEFESRNVEEGEVNMNSIEAEEIS